LAAAVLLGVLGFLAVPLIVGGYVLLSAGLALAEIRNN